ncbi:MAG: hypothetical protein V1900_01675 [Candidatus Aenigmatarchaeota archaeon]
MDFGRIFRNALKYPLDLKTFLPLFIVSLLLTIPSVTLMQIEYAYMFSGFTGTGFLTTLILLIISFLLSTLLVGLYVDNASYFPKRHPLKKSFAVAKKRFLPLLVNTMILSVIIFLPITVSTAVFISASSYAPSLVIAMLMLAAIVTLVLTFFTFLSQAFVVLGKAKPVDAIKKSYKTVKRCKLNAFAFLFFSFAVVMVLSLISSALPIFAGAYDYTGISYYIFEIIISTYSTLFIYAAIVGFYKSVKR